MEKKLTIMNQDVMTKCFYSQINTDFGKLTQILLIISFLLGILILLNEGE